jgi:hypothetical protein
MQIQWLQRTLSYCNKLVSNKAESELLDFVLAAEVWQGLHEDHDHDCWAKELLAGLMFVDPPIKALQASNTALEAKVAWAGSAGTACC